MFGGTLTGAVRRWPWPLLVLLLLGLAIAGIALFAFHAQSAALEKQALANLQTVARLKAEAIGRSLAAEEARTRILSRAPTFVEFLRRGIDRTSPEQRAHLATFLEEARGAAELDNLLLLDAAGRPLLAARDLPAGDTVWSDAAREALATGEIVFVDFRRAGAGDGVELGFVAAIRPAGIPGQPALGAVALDLAAARFLGPQLALWPAASTTGRTVLARKDGGDLLGLGQFGAAHDAALSFRRLPAGAGGIVARALGGETGPMIDADFRGARLLAASAAVPRTHWMLLVAMDRDEALAEVTRLAVDTGLLTAAALVAAIIFAFFLDQRGRLRAALAKMAHDRALHAAETQFRGVFEEAAIGIALATPNGQWLQVNRRLCDMLGYTEAELLARPAIAVTHPEDRAASQALMAGLLAGEADRFTAEKRYERRDGAIVWATTVVRLVRQADGTPDYSIAVIEDITERKRAEQQLADSEQRFRRVVESAPNAMVMSAADGTIAMVNRQAEMLFGHARGDLLGRPIEMLIPERFRQAHGGLHRSFVAAPRPRMMGAGRDLFGLQRDGREFPVEIGITPIETEAGLMVLATLVDLTERRRHEEALKKSEEQLQQSQKMQAIGNLTGGMAHDFNNLLGVIVGNLDLAQPLLEERRDAGDLVREALDAALRGADLTRRLLAFARRQPLRPRRVAIDELVAGTVKLLSRTLGENIEISVELADDLWPVTVDPAQLEAALVNLATNARDAMAAGGRLKVAAANRRLDADYASLHSEVTPGDYVRIEVSDTGTGMAPAILARIFEPFFTTKEVGKGTGLGLAMVFGFMKQSGGHVNVYSEPGAGSTFRLYMPRAAAAAAADAPEPDTAPARRAAGETVLAVEDNAALRRLVVRQLAELGYRVIPAQNATEALALLEHETVDLLFTDVVMPGDMDGFGLARHVLAHWPKIRVVLTSGFPETRIDGKLGVLTASTRLLSKPYRRTELARALRDALDG